MGQPLKLEHGADIFPRVIDQVSARKERGIELPISSLPQINDTILGLPKKKLVIIGARPSQGKSMLIAGFTWDLVQLEKTGLFFNLEMTNEEFVERIWSRECRINNYLLSSGEIVDKIEFYSEKTNKLLQDWKKNKLALIEARGLTYQNIIKTVEDFNQPIDFVVIDYLQMAKGFGNNKDIIDLFLKKMRDFAIEKDLCMIVASQINRGTHDGSKIKPPEMWELKGSGVIEEHADMIMLLHWQWKYEQEDGTESEYLINIAKNRGGRTGVFNTRIEPEHYLIKEKSYEHKTEDIPKYKWDRNPYRED